MVAPVFEGFQYGDSGGRYLGPSALKILYALVDGEHGDSSVHRKIPEAVIVLIILHISEFVDSKYAKTAAPIRPARS
jgi:hypothetical protein